MGTPAYVLTVRKYRPEDRQAVRDICAQTCWMGEHRIEMIADDWLWAEFWTRYYTDVESDLTWVVDCRVAPPHTGRLPSAVFHQAENCGAPAGALVGGYLTATADARRFEAYWPRLVPGIVWHVLRRRLIRRTELRRAIFRLLGMMTGGDLDVSPGIRRGYPATFHMDLLPQARQRGIGSTMVGTMLDELRRRRVPGIHGRRSASIRR